MQTKTKKIVLGMVSGVFGVCAVSGLCFGVPMLTKANTPEPTTITMEKGASMRLDADAPALRYFATLSDVKEGCDYGMLIVESDAIASVTENYHENLSADSYTDVACVPYVEGEKTYIRAALTTGFTTDNFCESYFTEYVAIGYEKTAEGAYTYATVDETYARSIASAAKACEALDYTWTTEEQSALDYFVAVADSQFEDDFQNGLSAARYTATNADVDAYAQIVGVYDGEVSTYLATDIYSDIKSVEFSLFATEFKNWFGFNIGTDTYIYGTPATFSKNGLGGNTATTTAINSVTFDVTAKWVDFKLEVENASDATLYINGIEAYSFEGYATADGKRSFTNGRVSFANGGANTLLVDNVRICYGENEVVEEGFSDGLGNMLAHGNVFVVNEGDVTIEASQYAGYASITGGYDGKTTAYAYTEYYQDITSVEFSLYAETYKTWFGIAFGDNGSIYRSPLQMFNTSVSGLKATVTTINSVSFDVSKDWVDFKFDIKSATEATLYINGVAAYELTNYEVPTEGKTFFNKGRVTISSAGIGSGVENSLLIDNVRICYGENNVMEETFSNGLGNIIGQGNVFAVKDVEYNYDTYKASNSLTVNKAYSVEGAEAKETALIADVTVQGSSVAFAIGESAADKGISVLVIENGKMFLRNVTDATIVDGAEVDVDISTAKTISISVATDGEVSVSVDGAEAIAIGVATYVGGNFSVIETSGSAAATITGLTFKAKVYA